MWKKDFLFSIVYILKQQLSILKDLLLDLLTQNISLSIKTKTKIHKHSSFYTGFKKGRNFKYKKIKSKNSFPCMFSYFRNAL